MPQNALNSMEWREMLGDDCERVYEELINAPGNLPIAMYGYLSSIWVETS